MDFYCYCGVHRWVKQKETPKFYLYVCSGCAQIMKFSKLWLTIISVSFNFPIICLLPFFKSFYTRHLLLLRIDPPLVGLYASNYFTRMAFVKGVISQV